ncbi:MAG: YgiT-type zinc finger protein [Caldilineaceae bacterium]
MQYEQCELCEGELVERQVLARFRYKGETIYIEHVPV